MNGEAFAVMAGSGFDALMIRDADDTIKSKLGTIAYVFSGAKHLRADLVHTKISVDGEEWFEGRTTMVLVGNFGEISGGLEVFPDAEPDDGLLDIAVMSASSLREWASIAWRLVRGRDQRVDLARRAQGRHIVVEHDEARTYELDGEDRDPATRLEFDIEPAAITVRQAGDRPTNDRTPQP